MIELYILNSFIINCLTSQTLPRKKIKKQSFSRDLILTTTFSFRIVLEQLQAQVVMSTSALPEDLSQHLSTITLPLPTDLAALFQKRSSLENDLASFEALSIEGDVKDVKELDQLFVSNLN